LPIKRTSARLRRAQSRRSVEPFVSTDELRRLRRVKWGALGLAALFLAIVEAYYYFLRGVPLIDDLVDWLIGMAGAAVLIEITFRAVANLQRRLQREITERKRAEEDLREHREHLEELVQLRTSELTEVNEALQWEIAERKRVFDQVRAGRERLAWLTQQVVSAQEEERQRLSRELHDEAGQALTALKISLELIQSDLPEEAGSLRHRLSEAVALTETTTEQIRLLAHDLRPPALDTVGLNYTLEGLCRDFAERTQLSVDYVGAELPALPEAANICLYRFLQEALTNVAKHAQASQVRVGLHCDAETVSLSVEDDGKGFDEQSGMSAGIGLLGMRERIELLGGKLDIESRSGQGTRLVARIPLQKAYLERRRAGDSRNRR